MPPYRANEVTINIADEVENSFRENLPLMINKTIWMIFPNKKHKFDAWTVSLLEYFDSRE